MEKLKVPAAMPSRALRPASGTAVAGPMVDHLPPVLNRIADIEIPKRVWSSWQEAGKPKMLRRALEPAEREVIERRVAELTPAVAGYGASDLDRVVVALGDMFGGFPSMRGNEEQAIARLDGARRMLAGFPAWAIEKGCRAIQRNGVWRDGKFDKQWPPSDAEIVAEAQSALRLYSDQHLRAVELLAAEFEG